MTSHFYWVGAIPAMIFVGIFMMPFYYGSKARSVPEYLKLRFDEKTRFVNAISFAVMTVMSSGISMYALAKLLELLLKWNFNFSLVISALIVLFYITFGGLTSAIYNEVLQFFLIVLGFIPLVYLGLKDAGGWSGLVERMNIVSTAHGFCAGDVHQLVVPYGKCGGQSDGCGLVHHGVRAGVCAFIWILVHRLPGGAASHGGGFDVRGEKDTDHCRVSQDALSGAGDSAGHDRDGIEL